MKKPLISSLFFVLALVAFWACQDHITNPGNPPGGNNPGGNTSGVAIASSLTVTSVMSTTNSANTSCSGSTGLAKVVCLTNAFLNTLDANQKTATKLTYNLTNAEKWSNLPAGLSARYGVNLASLNATQLAAFRDMMVAVLALNVKDEGYDEMLGNMVADNFLYYAGGGSTYGAGNFYVSILGDPSTTALWEILFTGHHYTQPFTFNGPAGSGYTPAFRGVEPTAIVSNTATGQTYQPMEQERVAFATLLNGLNSSEQATAKQSATYSDLVLGPGQDWKFPTTKLGLRLGNVDASRQASVLALASQIIKLYVNDLDVNATTAAALLTKYTNELADTYVAYSGNTSVTAQNDYIRLDGPSAWIEFSYQGGIVIQGIPHPHSVWRDRTTDYGGTK